MRPSEAFGPPRHAAAPDAEPAAALAGAPSPLVPGSGTTGPVGAGGSNSVAGSGVGSSDVPASYVVASEAQLDTVLDPHDPEGFRSALSFARYLHGKMPAATPSRPGALPATARPPRDHADTAVTTAAATAAETGHSPSGDADEALPPRLRTPDAVYPPPPSHPAHTHSISTSLLPALPPNFSPLFSQSTTASSASLSAMSSPSSRRDSLSGSLLIDDPLTSRDASFDMERGPGISGIGFGPSISAAEPASEANAAAAATTTTTTSRNEPATAASFLLCASSAGLSVTDSSMMDSGSAPQLIMPSIKMPSRRPFTESGKAMGRLKVLVAGDSGTGKTSLIKAIVQSCPHIVHIDHVTPPSFSLGATRRSSAATVAASTTMSDGAPNSVRSRRKSSKTARPDASTNQITEIYASTKPYPAWWNEVADASGLRRRKSLGDSVLDRNICFVDTPGFTRNTSTMDSIMPVVEYVEGYLQKLCSNALDDADFAGLVRGDGGTAVDVVLYMVAGHLKPADLEFLRLLTPLTNVIPLLARADSLRTEKDVADAKETIARQLHEAGIQPFVFTVPTAAHELALALASSSGLPQPYAVSSANGSDHDVMDASLLMHPDYVQPLVPTDLATLVEQVFCPDGIARLRHAAAQKFVQWRRSDSNDGSNNRQATRPQSLYRPLGLTAPLGAPSSFALARIADHTQREEHLAQIRLANWAAELQRNLDSERARYETLARNERAVWLTERLSECVQDGTLVAVPPAARDLQRQHARSATGGSLALSRKELGKAAGKRKKRSLWSSSTSNASNMSLSRSAFSHEDPLGLLEVTAGLHARGILVLEVLSSLGVLGGMALYMVKHDYHLQVYGWVASEWARLWNGER